jgi:hypothetical protein
MELVPYTKNVETTFVEDANGGTLMTLRMTCPTAIRAIRC